MQSLIDTIAESAPISGDDKLKTIAGIERAQETTVKTYSCSRYRVFLALALIYAGQADVVAASCDPQETRLSFKLETSNLPGDVLELVKTSSGLLEREGRCFRSLARLSALLSDDQDMFRKILRSEGFYGASIDTVRVRNGREVSIRMVMDGGQPYLNLKPRMAGLTHVPPNLEEALSRLAEENLVPGTRTRSSEIVSTGEKLLDHLKGEGYLFSTVAERNVLVDHATQKVSVTWSLAPGQKIMLGRATFQGLERTRESWLDTLINWEAGQTSSPHTLATWRKKLQETGLFSSIEVTPVLSDPEGNVADVLANVVEARPRRVELGLGYSTGLGAEARLSWRHKNFSGRGQTLSSTIRAGEKTQSIEGKWRIPHFNRADQVLQVDALAGHEQRPAYEAWRLKGGIGLERRLSKNFKGSVGLTASFHEVQEDANFDSFLLAGLPIGVGLDTTNNLFDPVKGNRLSLRVKPTLSALHNRFVFVTSELRASQYWSLQEDQRLVLASRVRLASIAGPALETIPATERFYAGGGGSVRGFGFQRLGPLDDDAHPTGGRSVLEGSLEMRFRTGRSLGFVIFTDAGSVDPDSLPSLNKMHFAVGTGVRYYTSFAPVRLDLATPVNRKARESRIALYISIGQSF